MASKQVTLREVTKAYADTGFRPMRKAWSKVDKHQACGLGVMAIARLGEECDEELWATNRYGIGYMRGFTCGFDARGKAWAARLAKRFASQPRALARFWAGYTAGRTVGYAVFTKRKKAA